MTRKTWIAGTVLALIAGLVGSFGGIAFANHQFSDVPTGSYFHDNVSAIKEAGCAAGYNDGTFNTSQAVTRGQFTLWFQNCLPRVARSNSVSATTFPGAGNTPTALLTDSITVGGFPGEQQFVRITAVADIRPTNGSFACPGTGSAIACDTNLTINVGGIGDVATQNTISAATDSFNNYTFRENMTVDAVVKVPSGSVVNYSLRGTSNTGTGGFTAENRTLTAQTLPFGPVGTAVGP